MGQFYLNNSKIYYPLDIQRFAASVSINAYETDVNVANNSSYVYVSISVSTSGQTFNYGTAYINGSVGGKSIPQTYFSIGTNSTVTVYSGKFGPFTHNADGSLGNVAVSVYAYLTSSTSASGSASVKMSTIPRYAKFTEYTVSDTGLNTATIKWNSDATTDAVQYSLNGGSWTNTSGKTYTISNLNPGTKYNVKTRIKRKDSQLWTESGLVYPTTKEINKITSAAPNAKNGSTLRVTANNPSGARCNIKLELPNQKVNPALIKYNTTDVTFTAAEITSLLQYIPNNKSTTLRATAITSNSSNAVLYTNSKDGTLTVVNSEPTFPTFTFEDVDATTVALTGNKQDCIVGYSDIKATVPVDGKSNSKNYATMSKYNLVIPGSTPVEAKYSSTANVSMTINNATSGKFTLNAIDSRGNISAVIKNARKTYNYTKISKTDTGTVQRVDAEGNPSGVSEYCNLVFNGKFWNNSFGAINNEITAKFRYRATDTNTFSDYIDLPLTVNTNGTFSFDGILKDSNNTVISFDLENVYVVEVLVSDKLSSATYSANLGSGKPHVAYAKNGVAIMGKYDDDIGAVLQINGNCILKDEKYLQGLDRNGNTIQLIRAANNVAAIGDSAYETGIWGTVLKMRTKIAIQNGNTTGITNANGEYIIRDHNNQNVTVDATGKTLFLGFQNTTALNILNGKASINSNGIITHNTNARLYGEVQLYNNTSGSNGTITLSETAANFTYLEIFYTDNNKLTAKSDKVYSPNGKIVNLDEIGTWRSGADKGMDFRGRSVKISGTSISTYSVDGYNDTGYLSFGNGAVITHNTSNYIYITRVIGYR